VEKGGERREGGCEGVMCERKRERESGESRCGQSRREGWDRLTGQLTAISLHDGDVFRIFRVEGIVIWGDCHESSATRACIED
jgi:hypothetical protein